VTVHLAHYLGLLHRAQLNLASAFREVATAHADEPDVGHLCGKLADECDRHAAELAPFAERYGEDAPDELLDVVGRGAGETAIQLKWLRTRMKEAAPQALVVAR
jgi:hypothetical protein